MSTSPTLPPPVPPQLLQDENANKKIWIAVAIVAILLLLILLFIFLPNGNGLSGSGGGGDGGSTIGQLGDGGGSGSDHSSAPPSSLGNSKGSTAGNDPGEKKGTAADGEAGKGPSDSEPPKAAPGGRETTLFLYDSNTPSDNNGNSATQPPTGGIAGSGNGQSYSNPGSSNPFIGTGPPARSTVYLVDASGSMASANRVDRARGSLRLAIEQLKPEQSFKVVFFNDRPIIDSVEKGLLRATPPIKQKIFDWMETIYVGGSTNPLEAMRFALSLSPERIVFMTDGEFQPEIASIITKWNSDKRGKRSKIDCAGLDEEVEVLKMIASQNSGTYYQMISSPAAE